MSEESTEIEITSIEDLPSVDSEQLAEVTSSPSHFQSVLLTTNEWGTFEVRWNGTTFILLKGIATHTSEGKPPIVSYEVLGHQNPDEEVDYPFPLDLSVLERIGRVLIHTVNTAASEDDE